MVLGDELHSCPTSVYYVAMDKLLTRSRAPRDVPYFMNTAMQHAEAAPLISMEGECKRMHMRISFFHGPEWGRPKQIAGLEPQSLPASVPHRWIGEKT